MVNNSTDINSNTRLTSHSTEHEKKQRQDDVENLGSFFGHAHTCDMFMSVNGIITLPY